MIALAALSALTAPVNALPADQAQGPALAETRDQHVYIPLAANVPPTGVIQGAIDHAGLWREYILYVPSSYTGRSPAPLIVNYHAYARDATVQMNYGDFRPEAERTGAIVAHPQGAFWNGARRWNVGGIYTHPLADDLGFTGALLDAVSRTYNVDQSRIYSAGFSNGGYMSYLVACRLSGRFAAVAVVAGSMTPEMLEECNPSRPLPILHIHGLGDAVVPYGGGQKSVAVEEVMAYWIAANGNDPTAIVRQWPDLDPQDGSTVIQLLYEGDNGISTELLQIAGGGHAWPGTASSTPGTNYDIDASAEIWSFFAKYDINGPTAAGD